MQYRINAPVACRWCGKTVGTLSSQTDREISKALREHAEAEHPVENAEYLRNQRMAD